MIKEIVKIWPFYLAFILLVIATSHNCFFWDTVLVPSCQASWYYGNHFSHFFLPDSINPGHPPFFPMYLAFAWTLFGRTLLVSHLAMLPFVLGIVFQANKLVSFYFSDKNRTIALMLLLADATLLSQCTLVSPDVILVLGFLTALNGLLYQKRWGIVLGSSMLVMIS